MKISGKIHWLCGMRIPIGSILLGCPGQEVIGSMGDWINGLVITDPYKWGIPWGEITH